MTPRDLDTALERLRLSGAALARECGVAPSTVYRWRQGDLPVPRYVERVLDAIRYEMQATLR